MDLNVVLSVLSTLFGTLFGVFDASCFLADAAAGAAAVNAGSAARGVAGVDDSGVHTMTQANYGLVTDTERLGADGLIDDPVDKMIVKMYQSAVPVDQICRHLPQTKQNSMRYSFWSVDTRPIEGKVTEAYSAPSTGGVVQGEISVEDANIFDKTDLIVVPGVKGYRYNSAVSPKTTYSPLVLYVVDIKSNNKLIVQSVNGSYVDMKGASTIPNIPTGSVIYRLGHAASEGDVQTTPYAALPMPDQLHMQIFKTQVMESTISIDSDKKVNWSLSDQNELALYNMRKEIELAYIYGVKGYFREETSKRYVYTCSGAIQQILEKGTVISYDESSLTEKSLLNGIVKPVFLKNSGSSTRYMFAGSDIVASIALLPSVAKQMNATQTLRKFGIDWKTIQFMSWQINLYQHPLLDEIGLSKCAFVLDLANVRKEVFRSMTSDILDLIKSGIFDGKSTVWTEISSIALKYPKTHAFVYEPSQFNPA